MSTDQIPDPRTDLDAFKAWSLLYLDRALDAKDELAFERKLVDSPEAALAFRQAAEMDVSLFEAASQTPLSVASGPLKRRKPKTTTSMPKVTRIPSLQSADAEALDPANLDDMKFVTEICTDLTGEQERARARSQRHERITRGWRRYWLHATVSAGVAAALALIFAESFFPQDPDVTAGTRHHRSHPATAKSASNTAPNSEENPLAPEKDAVIANNDGSDPGVLPSPQPFIPERDSNELVKSPEPPPAPKAPKEGDLLPTATAEKKPETQSAAATVTPGAADPRDAERLNEGMVWLPLGTVKMQRDPARVEIGFKRDENAFNRDERVLGGLLYARPLDPARAPSMKLTLDAPLFSSETMDFQFVIYNKVFEGKRVVISPKDFLPLIKDRANLKDRKHTLEMIVKKFNQFELRIDGMAVTRTDALLQPEWEKMYVGFVVSARGGDTETVFIEHVTLGGSESRK